MKREKPQFKSKNRFKFLVFVFSFSILNFTLASAPVLADESGQDNFVYLFHLYYDNGQLFADRDFEFKYDVLPEKYIAETVTTQFPFKGEIVNLRGETVKTFQFDPRRGNPNFLKGKISVKAPYVPDGQKAVFFDSQDRQLLTIFVSESSFCNDDGVCNFERGEDANTCPSDCAGITQTPQPGLEGDETGGEGGLNLKILLGLIAALAAAGGWYGWRWRKKRKLATSAADQFTNKLP